MELSLNWQNQFLSIYSRVFVLRTYTQSSHMPRHCKVSPDAFCYVCGKYTTEKQRCKITASVENGYNCCFNQRIVNLHKPWVPSICCTYCRRNLSGAVNGKKKMPFSTPMIWREPANHTDDCYFCLVQIQGHSAKSKDLIVYPRLKSVDHPIFSESDNPLPRINTPMNEQVQDTVSPENCMERESMSDSNFELPTAKRIKKEIPLPSLINQGQLDDLIRDMDLPKCKAEIMGSRFKEWGLITPEVRISRYRTRDNAFHDFFYQRSGLVLLLQCGGSYGSSWN